MTGQDQSFKIARSGLDPRIVLYRYTGSNRWGAQRYGTDSSQPVPGTATPAPWNAQIRGEHVRWSPEAGAVTCGQQARHAVGSNLYYRIISFADTQVRSWWDVTCDTGIAEVYPAPAAGVGTPPTPVPADSADAPIAYRVDPNDGNGPALIDPASIKVRVLAYVGGQAQQIDLKPTANFDQASIRGDEFCPLLYRQDYGTDAVPDGTCLMIRLSRYDPPRPNSVALFGSTPAAASGFQIQVLYYYRRNYVYDAARDAAGQDPFVNDIVKVDYSTRALQNVKLSLQRYTELLDVGAGRLCVPPEERPNEVTVSERIAVRSYGR